MSREERIKEIQDMIKSQQECIKATKDSPFTDLWKKQNKALEQAITDMQILDKVEEKLKEDIKITDNIINEREYRYIQEVIDEAYEKNHYAREIFNLIGGKNNE